MREFRNKSRWLEINCWIPASPSAIILIELFPGKRRFLSRPLHFNKSSIAGHDHVHIDGCIFVLLVVQVEEKTFIDRADTYCGHQTTQRPPRKLAPRSQRGAR